MMKTGKNEPVSSDKDVAEDISVHAETTVDKSKKHAPETSTHKKHPSEDHESAAMKEKTEKAAAEILELKDRYLRLLAEYENYRKRSQKEREALYLDAIADIAKEWLPVIDNIERTQCFSKEISDTTAEKISEGIDLISRQVQDVMGKLGIKEIACEEGGCFDPELHEAVLHINDESLGEQCVSQVFLKGYRAGDRIIRHSVVKVAN
jgi:molecular chaperone GrpE